MSKKFYIIYWLTTLFSLSVFAQSPLDQGLAAITRTTAEAHVRFLAADELKGREAGSAEGRVVANYLAAQLQLLGVHPLLSGCYFQPFEARRVERQRKGAWEIHPDSLAHLGTITHARRQMQNVLGVIPGRRTDECVIVGAHYDHLGVDPLLAGDAIYNGADDNASGVSAVLQLAKAFMLSGKQPERTVIFAFWDGEELGLLGSRYFMQNQPVNMKISGYLNYDMIGRDKSADQPWHVVYFYTEAHPVFEKWLKEDIKQYGFRLQPDYRAWDKPVGGSDNASFALHNIPIIWYHTDGHPDYHQPSDHADRIHWDKLVEITKASFLNLWRLANETHY